MPDLPENEKAPNVLTREEAALLVKANEQPQPDNPEEMERFSKLLDRLADWVEQPEQARVVAKTYEVPVPEQISDEDDEGWREATDEDIAAGGTLVPDQPAPTNLAEKLREEGESRMGSYGGGTYQFAHRKAADALEAAIPPEVWGRVIALHSGFAESDVADEPPVSDYCAALDALIATFCPPEIAQQHGWEPRTTDKETT